MKIACTVSYEGTNYAGFQRQKNDVTIQEELEKAFYKISQQKVVIYCSGRTDSGVHALGQVFHFEMPDIKIDSLQKYFYSLNCILPKDISIIYFGNVDKTFHARFSCTQREYVYQVCNTPFRQSIFKNNALWIRKPLELNKMLKAASYLIGTHDFAAFTHEVYLKNGEPTIRRINLIKIIQDGPLILFYFAASGFLHNMIRIIMGCLLEVGTNKWKPEKVQEVLKSKNRNDAAMTISSCGLFFLNAAYEKYQTPPDLFASQYRSLLTNPVLGASKDITGLEK